MNATLFRNLFLLVVLFLSLCAAASENRGLAVRVKTQDAGHVELYKGSQALLIGVSDYQGLGWSDLASIPGELQEVRRAVEAKGFQVTQVMDPTSAELKKAFQDFMGAHGFDPDNRLLVYFAGHGYSDGEKGYLVPADAPNPQKDLRGFKQKALFMNNIIRDCENIDARHALFLFDSCFSGTIFQQRSLWKSPPPHIESWVKRPVRQFISAGSANQEVPARSIFTPAFIDGIGGDADANRDGYVTGQELGVFLHDTVVTYSKTQTPQYGKIQNYRLSKGDFVFQVKPDGVQLAHVARPTPVALPRVTGPAEAVLTGSLEVLGGEVEAYVRIDGGSPVKLRPGTKRTWSSLVVGRHEVLIEWPEGEQTERVFVSEGEVSRIRCEAKEKAKLPADLLGVEGAGPAPLSGLAPGSREAQARQVSEAEKAGLPLEVKSARLGMVFRYVPSGRFLMGSPSSEQEAMVRAGLKREWVEDEGPQREVTISRGAYVGKYEVTQGEWERVMGSNPSKFPNAGRKAPVEQVSWEDCQEFVRKLCALEGVPSGTYRLLTEAEWEYACRAGSSSALYTGGLTLRGKSNGPELDRIGWYSGNSGVSYSGGHDSSGWEEKQYAHRVAGTHPVGQKASNAFGLHDMIGNVREWCEDWYGASFSGGTDPAGPSSGSYRVNRGGSWGNSARDCRSALRDRDSPDDRWYYLGLRLLRTSPTVE